jgi:hypothetical protein
MILDEKACTFREYLISSSRSNRAEQSSKNDKNKYMKNSEEYTCIPSIKRNAGVLFYHA